MACESSSRGRSDVVATGRVDDRISRFSEGDPILQYEFKCACCGRTWWFAGKKARAAYEAQQASQVTPAPSS